MNIYYWNTYIIGNFKEVIKMVFIDQMKNFKIYRTKTFLPTVKGDKKKGSTVLLLTPNYE